MSQATGGAAAQDRVMVGVGYALAAMFLYAVTEAVAKWLTADFHPTQILLIRCFAALAMVAVLASRSSGWSVLRTRQPMTQALRGVAGAASMTLAIFAYAALPLAEAVSIVYAAPIMVVLLSIPVLGEKVGWRRLTAVGVGFVGLILIVRPGAGAFQPAALLALTAMVLYALSNVLTRKLAKTDNPLTTMIYTQIAFLVICLPPQIDVWRTPDAEQWRLLLLVAVAGSLAQMFLTSSYRYAQASVISVFDYTTILWSALFAFVIWRELPSYEGVLGMAVVIGAGVYIALRELTLASGTTKTAARGRRPLRVPRRRATL